MARRSIRALLATLLLAVALVAPSVATGKSDVIAYQLQYQPYFDDASGLLIVTATLDPEVSLPASVTVPVPASGQILWVGEILGGAAEADPERIPAIEPAGDMQLLTITAEQSRLVQAEVVMLPAVASGKSMRAKLTWTNPGPDEVAVGGSVRLEPNISNVEISPPPPAAPQTNSIGETLYSLGELQLGEGQSYSIDVSYDRGQATGGPTNVLLYVLIAALAAVVIALVVVTTRQRGQGDGDAETKRPARPEQPVAGTPSAADEEFESVTDDESFMNLD
jgi:hypothetical protein